MLGIKVRDGEAIESALKRFKKECEKAGLLTEIKKREYYEKPSVTKKKKNEAARRKREKKLKLLKTKFKRF
ncbi:MAG: 30S ribosomal protein S21 [Spirochaetes bacterium]|nr:30S ribosomal protein S21 [Spirochaetota bacterium]